MAGRKRRGDGGVRAYYEPDAHSRAAKAAGYAARSVFKLEEIDKRLRLIKQSERIIDLGAAPGSWSAYAAKKVGRAGRVVSIDRQAFTQALPAYVTMLQGDVFDEALLASEPVIKHLPYDVVLSDMAPNTTGDKTTDKIRSLDVFMRAVELSTRLLKPGGHFVGKLFMSGHFPEARERLRTLFTKVKTMRPEAVRAMSYEVFLIGLELRATDE